MHAIRIGNESFQCRIEGHGISQVKWYGPVLNCLSSPMFELSAGAHQGPFELTPDIVRKDQM